MLKYLLSLLLASTATAANLGIGTNSVQIVVSNAASLLFAPTNVGKLTTAGYYVPGDGGGGIFNWISGSAITTNHGTVWGRASGGAGRWIETGIGPLDVKLFGAQTNGSDATPGLTNWLQAAASGKRVAFLSAGEYQYTVPLMVSNVAVEGIAGLSILVPRSGVSAAVILNGGGTAWGLADWKNIDIDGRLNPGGTGILLGSVPTGATGISIENVDVYAFDTAGGRGLVVSNAVWCNIRDSIFRENDVGMESPSNVTFPTTITFECCFFLSNFRQGVLLRSARSFKFTDCIYEVNLREGFLARPALGGFVEAVDDHGWFEANWYTAADDTNNFSVVLDGSSTGVLDMTLRNPTYSGGSDTDRFLTLTNADLTIVRPVIPNIVSNLVVIRGAGSLVTLDGWRNDYGSISNAFYNPDNARFTKLTSQEIDVPGRVRGTTLVSSNNVSLSSFGDSYINAIVGNLGVGTTNTSGITVNAQLEVAGDVNLVTAGGAAIYMGVNAQNYLFLQNAGSYAGIQNVDNNGYGVLALNEGGGNVGIGTNAPQTTLHIHGSVTVTNDVYDATVWNGNLTVPTKDAIRDKIETLGGGGSGIATNAGTGFNNTFTNATHIGVTKFDGSDQYYASNGVFSLDASLGLQISKAGSAMYVGNNAASIFLDVGNDVQGTMASYGVGPYGARFDLNSSTAGIGSTIASHTTADGYLAVREGLTMTPGVLDSGGYVMSVFETNNSFTVTSNVCAVIVDTTSGGVLITLPTGVGVFDGQWFRVKNIGVNTVTITNGNGSDKIDGALSTTLTAQYQSVDVVRKGTNYWKF